MWNEIFDILKIVLNGGVFIYLAYYIRKKEREQKHEQQKEIKQIENESKKEQTDFIGQAVNNEHIYDEYGIFINHSFSPNIVIKNKNVVALYDIKADEEVAFNYNDSEPKMAAPFSLNGVMVDGNPDIN